MTELIPLKGVQSQLREKVQQAMLDLIPPEAFDKYIEDAWRSFTEDRDEVKDHYGHVTQRGAPPEIITMIQYAMRTEIKRKVDEWAEEWAKGEEAQDAAKRVFEECSRVAASAFVDRVVASAIDQALSSIGPTGGRTCSCGRFVQPGTSCAGCGTWCN